MIKALQSTLARQYDIASHPVLGCLIDSCPSIYHTKEIEAIIKYEFRSLPLLNLASV
jgi:hypothetical protein